MAQYKLRNGAYPNTLAFINNITLTMNKTQIIGGVLLAVAIAAYFLNENYIPDFILGLVAAIGAGFLFKLIPFKKKNPAN